MDRLLPAALRNAGPEPRRRARLVAGLSAFLLLSSLLALIGYAATGMLAQDPTTLVMMVFDGLAYVAVLVLLWRTASPRIPGIVLCLQLLLSMFMWDYSLGGLHPLTIANYLIVPMTALLLAGRRWSVVILALILVESGLTAYFKAGGHPFPVPPPQTAQQNMLDSLMVLYLCLGLTLGLAWLFEASRRDALQELRHSLVRNKELDIARKAAEDANLSKSIFLSTMSHELRTPLNAIIGYAEMLEEELGDDASGENAADAGRIRDAGHHLLALVDDVLDLSKIEAGKMPLVRTDTDLEGLVREVVATGTPLVAKNDSELRTETDAGLGLVNTDSMRLRQVLLNLVGNAAKFTRRGTVTLRATRYFDTETSMDWVRFEIEDTGIGMPPDKLDQVFEKFIQAESDTTRKYGGTGLGLPIARELVILLGGRIDVTSEVGRGSLFTVRLPVAPPPAP